MGSEMCIRDRGNYAGKSLDKAAVTALANIPSREVLLAQVLGMMLVPVASFTRGLAALAAKKGEGAEPAAAAPAAESTEAAAE